MSSEDYYALLGVEPSADGDTVRRAWRRLATRWHPDRAGPSGAATFKRISTAYVVLSDARSRAAYDLGRDVPPAPVVPVVRAPGVLLSSISGPLRSLLMAGVARWDGPVLELSLGAEAAKQGGMATIAMPVWVRCDACTGGVACARCHGGGVFEDLFSAWLAVSPGIADGTMLSPTVPMKGMIQPLKVRIRVR
jgi:DnaJ-class molecular chaperone